MTTSTLALDGTSYAFLGYGCHSPCYEKGRPLTNYGGDLSTANFNSLVDDVVSLFAWMRIHIHGGEQFAENAAGTYNYPAKKQSQLLAAMNARGGPWKYLVSPLSVPSVAVTSGDQDTLREATPTLLAAPTYSTGVQDHLDTTAAWQATLDSTKRGLNQLLLAGCDIRVLTSPNEVQSYSVANFWSCEMDSAAYINHIHKVWLGTGMTGAGVKAAFPWLSYLADTPGIGNEFRTALLADSTALAECTYHGHHSYDASWSAADQQTMGITTDTSLWGDVCVTEFGQFGGDSNAAGYKLVSWGAHAHLCYGKAPISCHWTVLRDVTAKAAASSNGVTYSARPLANLTTASNSYALRADWYALKPYLVACGRGPADVLCVSTAGTSDANFDPAAGVYVTHFKRGTDGKECTVYANFSGAARAGDVLHYTVGGSAHDMSGNKRTYSCNTVSESNDGAVSTTSGSYTLPSVADGETVLLEWTL